MFWFFFRLLHDLNKFLSLPLSSSYFFAVVVVAESDLLFKIDAVTECLTFILIEYLSQYLCNRIETFFGVMFCCLYVMLSNIRATQLVGNRNERKMCLFLALCRMNTDTWPHTLQQVKRRKNCADFPLKHSAYFFFEAIIWVSKWNKGHLTRSKENKSFFFNFSSNFHSIVGVVFKYLDTFTYFLFHVCDRHFRCIPTIFFVGRSMFTDDDAWSVGYECIVIDIWFECVGLEFHLKRQWNPIHSFSVFQVGGDIRIAIESLGCFCLNIPFHNKVEIVAIFIRNRKQFIHLVIFYANVGQFKYKKRSPITMRYCWKENTRWFCSICLAGKSKSQVKPFER